MQKQAEPSWRVVHLGRLLGNALRRFDERVLWLMSRDVLVPLALSNQGVAPDRPGQQRRHEQAGHG
jgi:hypothetical protein